MYLKNLNKIPKTFITDVYKKKEWLIE